jgi:hypothetical protein
LRNIEQKIDIIFETREYIMMKPQTRKELEEKEKQLDKERKKKKHDNKKEQERVDQEKKVRKNQEKIQKQESQKMFKGRANRNRSTKKMLKTVVDESEHDEEHEDMIRYGLIQSGAARGAHSGILVPIPNSTENQLTY